jgi:hypothetical protein
VLLGAKRTVSQNHLIELIANSRKRRLMFRNNHPHNPTVINSQYLLRHETIAFLGKNTITRSIYFRLLSQRIGLGQKKAQSDTSQNSDEYDRAFDSQALVLVAKVFFNKANSSSFSAISAYFLGRFSRLIGRNLQNYHSYVLNHR